MLAMSLLLGGFKPATAAASMAIGKPEAIDDAPLSGRSAAEDGGGESFLPREEWVSARGKKVDPTPLRLKRSRRSHLSAKSSREEAVWSAGRSAPSGEDVADFEYRPAGGWRSRRVIRARGARNRVRNHPTSRAGDGAKIR
jgi:hypothetical protein